MTVSGMLVTLCSLVLIAWDLIAVYVWGITASESWFIHNVIASHPYVLLGCGILIGHFVAGMSAVKESNDKSR